MKTIFKYDPINGTITKNGKNAVRFSKDKDAMVVYHEKRLYLATHLIWNIIYNEKVKCIKFKNDDKTDLRLENLFVPDKKEPYKTTKKCKGCKKDVPKENYDKYSNGRLKDKCNECLPIDKSFTANSYEEKRNQHLTAKEVLALAKERESKKKLVRVPIFKGYKLCEVK